MFALMNQDLTFSGQLNDGTSPVKWNDMTLPPLRSMTKTERVAQFIYDFVQAGSTPDYNTAVGTTYVVNKTKKEVTEVVAYTPFDAATMGKKRSEEVTQAIKTMLDEKAVELRYDNIMSARSYAGYVNPFQAEALKLAAWASACWVMAGTIEAEVIAGAPLPTVEAAMARMPDYV